MDELLDCTIISKKPRAIRTDPQCAGGILIDRGNFFADSGAITMVHVLNILSETQRSLSEIMGPLRRYHATGEVNFDVEDKDAKIAELAEAFKDGAQDRLDGLTVEYDRWWFNVRPSNTEPTLRLNLEADASDLMEEKRAEVVRILAG